MLFPLVALKREYVVRAKKELKIIEPRLNALGAAVSNIVDTVLFVDRYIVSAEKGADILFIKHPSKPKKYCLKVLWCLPSLYF